MKGTPSARTYVRTDKVEASHHEPEVDVMDPREDRDGDEHEGGRDAVGEARGGLLSGRSEAWVGRLCATAPQTPPPHSTSPATTVWTSNPDPNLNPNPFPNPKPNPASTSFFLAPFRPTACLGDDSDRPVLHPAQGVVLVGEEVGSGCRGPLPGDHNLRYHRG